MLVDYQLNCNLVLPWLLNELIKGIANYSNHHIKGCPATAVPVISDSEGVANVTMRAEYSILVIMY